MICGPLGPLEALGVDASLGPDEPLAPDASLGEDVPLAADASLGSDAALATDAGLADDAACAAESIVNAGIVYAATATPPIRASALRRDSRVLVSSVIF
jgi:hypothetical protein